MKELETERLLLRRIRREDAQRIFDCWASDPEVTRYLTWQPHASVAVTEAIVARWLADYDKPDTYRYGIELRETGELIGMIDVVGYHHGNPVIGYCSGRAYWGNGYMTEALKALCAALFEAGYSMIRIEAVRENVGSNRVIQKAGFRLANSREQPMSESKPEIVTINSYYLTRE